MLYTPGLNVTVEADIEPVVLTKPIGLYEAQEGVVKAGIVAAADLPQYTVVAIQTSTGSVIPYVDGGADGAGTPVGILKSAIGTTQAPESGGVTSADMAVSYYVKGTFYINDPAATLLLKGYDAQTVPNSNGWTVNGNVLTVK